MEDFENELSTIREGLSEPLPPALGILYHYTDVYGFQGIIKCSQWYATHYLYVNDGKEIIYGDEIVQHEIEGRIEEEENPWIKEIFRQSIHYDLSASANVSYDLYTVAFSEKADLLDQWRAYGDDGAGYSIGINPHELLPQSKLRFLRIEYDEVAQKKTVIQMLDKVYEVLKQALTNASDEERLEISSTAAQYLARMRIDLSLSFKHPAFNNEKEWRIVIEKWKRLLGGENSDAFANVHYRPSNGILVPFLKLPLHSAEDENLLPLRSVIIGPKHRYKKQQAKNSLEMQLRTKGYKKGKTLPTIRISDLPYQ